MKIVVIQPGHNATVALFKDGECLNILHEEKFNNIKNYSGWPKESLEYLSKKTTFKDVEIFIFSTIGQLFSSSPTKAPDKWENISSGKLRKFYDFLEYKTEFKDIFTGIKDYILYNRISPKARQENARWMMKFYQIPKEKIKYFDHHLNHCLTPLFFYGLNKSKDKILLMSLDGAGDYSCSKIYIYDPNGNSLKNISDTGYDSSVGVLYSEMTKFLGMRANEHEYKVMGLAAYVSNEKYYKHIYEKLSEIIWFDEKTLTFQSKFNTNVARLFFRKYFCEERFDNLSAAIQKLTENLVMKWITATIRQTGIRKIALSGGVFMNVKLNQKVLELPELKKVYFQPSASDESIVIGAGCKFFMEEKIEIKAIKSMYLGLEYNNLEVEKFLKENGYFKKYGIEYFEDIELKIADLLSKFIIVARFKGRGEWGARSLCNRAILGNASDLKIFYEVNDMIKMRDFWMPFAPTILSEWADKYIQNWDSIKEKSYESSKYMIVSYNTTLLAQRHLRAAMHQKDKTIRPQIVDKNDNPDLYRLLKYYEKITGMGGFLNTSFNLHGYPLVGTLEQALFTFGNSDLRYLALENYLIKK